VGRPTAPPLAEKAAKAQAIGPSRGGQTTKIHAVTDLLGHPAILRLTAGNVADVSMAGPLMDAAGQVRCLIADKGYDANALSKTPARRRCRCRHTRALEPEGPDRPRLGPIQGALAHRAFCRLKESVASPPDTTISPANSYRPSR